eukprot:UN29759
MENGTQQPHTTIEEFMKNRSESENDEVVNNRIINNNGGSTLFSMMSSDTSNCTLSPRTMDLTQNKNCKIDIIDHKNSSNLKEPRRLLIPLQTSLQMLNEQDQEECMSEVESEGELNAYPSIAGVKLNKSMMKMQRSGELDLSMDTKGEKSKSLPLPNPKPLKNQKKSRRRPQRTINNLTAPLQITQEKVCMSDV